MSSGWAIICDNPNMDNNVITVQGLVDRNKTKEKWWTDTDPDLLMEFDTREAAENHIEENYSQGNPRAIKIGKAEKKIGLQKAYLNAKARSSDSRKSKRGSFNYG